jgi:hypothetical protein
MNDRTKHRLRRVAWVMACVIAWFALWYPADWLAGLVIPADWPGGTTLSGPAAEQWTRRWNRHYWLCYGIWFVLTLICTVLVNLVWRRRWNYPAPSAP